ncbi:MAG: hypothetical protein WCF04_04550 [Candidatus Nanopelagicales bacterium]
MPSPSEAFPPSNAAWPWAHFFAEDPRDWVLGSGEPAAHWALLTGVLDRGPDDAWVAAAQEAVLADPGTEALIRRLPDWEAGMPFSGHDSPAFAPNLLALLADMGVRAGDDPRIDRLLEQMLAHQDGDGRFASFAPLRGSSTPVWGALLCDSHATTEVLVRYGLGGDARVHAALVRMAGDLTTTAQGPAWPCRPDPATGFRGPGRRGDCCPQVTLEALRTFARLPSAQRPAGLHDVARTSLRAWTDRGTEKPYMFGHGRTFKTVKWPAMWYRVDAILDGLGRYPGLWAEPGSSDGDRRALAELAACLIAYNMTTEGRVVPRSTYREFESFSFGQKAQPSPFATARLLAILHRLDVLAPDAAAVDVTGLGSSRGGTGRAAPPIVGQPRRQPRQPSRTRCAPLSPTP